MNHHVSGKAPLGPMFFHCIHAVAKHWMHQDPREADTRYAYSQRRAVILKRQGVGGARLPDHHRSKSEHKSNCGCYQKSCCCSLGRAPDHNAAAKRKSNQHGAHCSEGNTESQHTASDEGQLESKICTMILKIR